jgi:hypothetical protein
VIRRSPPWQLRRFTEELDSWSERESPADDLLLVILPWILSRIEDPYVGVRREAGFENLWFGAVPGTDDGAGRVVCCSYWIFDAQRTVRCNSFCTLHLPL